MPAKNYAQRWPEFSSGIYVSAGRMQADGRMFSLKDAANMDIDAFNKAAERFGVCIEDEDTPMHRLAKYSVFLSRNNDDNYGNSRILNNPRYVATAIEAASKKKKEPFKSFYRMLTHDAVDFVGEILSFKEHIKTGADKGKYIAERLVFNEDAELENEGPIKVAPEGWTRVLGMSCYPIETSTELCRIENIEIPGLSDKDSSGLWCVGGDPVGQERIALRGPSWYDGRLLSASVCGGRSFSPVDVGALRSRI